MGVAAPLLVWLVCLEHKCYITRGERDVVANIRRALEYSRHPNESNWLTSLVDYKCDNSVDLVETIVNELPPCPISKQDGGDVEKLRDALRAKLSKHDISFLRDLDETSQRVVQLPGFYGHHFCRFCGVCSFLWSLLKQKFSFDDHTEEADAPAFVHHAGETALLSEFDDLGEEETAYAIPDECDEEAVWFSELPEAVTLELGLEEDHVEASSLLELGLGTL